MGEDVRRAAARVWNRAEARSVVVASARSGGTDVISRGDVSNRELPESGQRVVDDFTTITLVWGGTYEALKAVQPNKGDVDTEYDGFAVQSSTLAPRKGGMGQLTIVLSDRVAYDSLTSAKEFRERWEIDWQSIEKDLAQHKYISDDAQADQIVEEVELWRNTETRLRIKFKYIDAGGTQQELTGKALELAQKIVRGQESYVVYAPVMRRIRDYQGRPETAGGGFVDTPEEAVEGYEYLKTGDRLVQQSDDVWQRVEEWTGADSWDDDLYGASGAWSGTGATT